MIIDFAKLRRGLSYEIDMPADDADQIRISIFDQTSDTYYLVKVTVDCQEGIDALLDAPEANEQDPEGPQEEPSQTSDPVGDLKYSTDREFETVREEIRRGTDDLSTRLDALLSEIQALRNKINDVCN